VRERRIVDDSRMIRSDFEETNGPNSRWREKFAEASVLEDLVRFFLE